MALVTLPSGETIVESPGPTLDYYRGEGYLIADEAAPVTLPRVFDGEQYVGEEPAVVGEPGPEIVQLPEGQFVEADTTEKTHPGTGVISEGIEASADGTFTEVSSDPAASDTDDKPSRKSR